MKIDIILAGVGGQGILSIATTIGYAAVNNGLYLKQAEVHGMSQRGGDVQSNLRISDEEIFSDLIPKGQADLIISVEPMEALRYLPLLSKTGWVITNDQPFNNISNYPAVDDIMGELSKLPQKIIINADQIAKDLGSPRSANMVILGAASPFLTMEYQILEDAIAAQFASKGQEVVDVNIAALKAGREYAMKNK
ncbi:MAG: indolepyruvate oxidoreductase subunit beta [Bacteroidales bacterium]|nr:indolepyruvate oxidoreductase subunit beta [Bacteroidales bacterium]